MRSARVPTLSNGRASDADAEQKAYWEKLVGETKSLIERWHFPKPIIARVNGFALGGGLEQALACDIIVAADHAEFVARAAPWVDRGSAGVYRLPRQIGLKTAMGYMLTGRHMTAARAYELGLVNQVVPLDQFDAAVDEWVVDIVRCAPLAVSATKEAATCQLSLGAGLLHAARWRAETPPPRMRLRDCALAEKRTELEGR